MQVSIFSRRPENWTGSVLMVGLTEGDLSDQISQLGIPSLIPLLKNLQMQNFKGKPGEIITFNFLEKNFEKLVITGLGPKEKLIVDDLREATALGSRSSLGFKDTLGVILPWEGFNLENAYKAVAEAARLSIFKDLRFVSSHEPHSKPKNLELIGPNISTTGIFDVVYSTCKGVELARELVGAPANQLTPALLADTASKIAKEHNLHLKILEKEECKKLGMGAYLAVSQGSDLDPKFIHLTYKPNQKAKRKLAIVGKGLTFDSGGYNLKVGASQIELMKFDMGGSAAVLGAAKAIGEKRPLDVEVHFIIAACENMINGSAIHPGDIVKASNNKTIEINNTDAEGRLTLADALVYASSLQPHSIVDLATLTGACVIALGEEIAGLWTDSDDLGADLMNAANSAGEGLWRMPLQNSYKDGLKSLLADMKNTGPRAGGSITAALFLREFIDSSIPWAHIDIAGTVWSEKDRGINPAGATGFGVRTLLNWIDANSNQSI